MYQHTEITRPAGINKDLSPFELPPELWSDGENIDFRRNRTSKSKGYSNSFTLTDSVVPPLFVMYFTDNTDTFWLYGSEAAIYKTDGSIATEMATGFNATRERTWNGINFNTKAIMNNVLDHPQVMDDGNLTMIDLPNWGATAGGATNLAPWGIASRCKVMRGYKNYIFALDCYDQSGIRYPSMVRWSSPAESGDVPPSWDALVAGEQAGLYTLADTPGAVVDGLTLGDYFMIYKTDSVWQVQFIGGDFTMSFRKVFGDEAGCLGTDCVAEYDGKHFVLTATGAYVHNGQTKEEIMEQWVKDEFFGLAAPETIQQTKIVADHNNKEIWIYYITQSSVTGWADRAIIYNWETTKWSMKELSGISHVAEGIVEKKADVNDWDSSTDQWDDNVSEIWNSDVPISPIDRGLLISDYIGKVFYKNELGELLVDQPLTGRIKRIGIDFDDDANFKYITRVIPHVLGQNPVTVTIYASDTQDPSPTIAHQSTFNPITDVDVDCHVSGRYIGIEFSSEDFWTLTGYSLEWEPVGRF